MEYINLSISKKESKFYQKSKEPKDGYVKILYGTDNKEVTYHKYQNSAKGVPTSFEQKNIEYDGRTLRFLELTLYDEETDTQTKISVNSKNKSGYTDEVRKLVSALNSAEAGRSITFTIVPNTYTNKKGEKVSTYNIYGNYNDENGENGKPLSTGFIKFEDIPKGESKEVAGDVVWDYTKQTEFYYERILEISTRFANQNSQGTKDTKLDDDNLPF